MDWIDERRKQRERDAIPKYGVIHPLTDPRNFRKEMLDELLDALNYAQWAHEKGEISTKLYVHFYYGLKEIINVLDWDQSL